MTTGRGEGGQGHGLVSYMCLRMKLGTSVEWIAKNEGAQFIIHYLDDFLVMGPPASTNCAAARSKLLSIFDRLGLPVAEKLEGPTTALDFLGFTLDTMAFEVRLPATRLAELQVLLQQWQGRKACTRRELESITSKLAHAAKVVRPGKTFMGRMFKLLGGVRQAHHRVRLNLSFRSDLQWWNCFLTSWNGVSLIRPLASSHNHLWTDASGHFSCGAFVPSSQEWCQLQWPNSYPPEWVQLKDESITLKELLSIVLACAVWGSDWVNQAVSVHFDNLGVVSLVNSGYSRVPQIMHLLRCLFFIIRPIFTWMSGHTCPGGAELTSGCPVEE